MNAFQKQAIDSIRSFLSAIGALEESPFGEVEGRKESFQRGVLRKNEKIAEVFIYKDEAGLMLEGKDWMPFERPDFKTPEALISALVGGLRGYLEDGKGGSAAPGGSVTRG